MDPGLQRPYMREAYRTHRYCLLRLDNGDRSRVTKAIGGGRGRATGNSDVSNDIHNYYFRMKNKGR